MREETTSRVIAADRPYDEIFTASVWNILDTPTYGNQRRHKSHEEETEAKCSS
jgi:hypothetical protein